MSNRDFVQWLKGVIDADFNEAGAVSSHFDLIASKMAEIEEVEPQPIHVTCNCKGNQQPWNWPAQWSAS